MAIDLLTNEEYKSQLTKNVVLPRADENKSTNWNCC